MRLWLWATPDAADPTVRLLRDAAADAQRSRLPQMAAALSYRTIFGILPVLAVGLWILHGMVPAEKLTSLIGQGIDALGLSNIAVDTQVADEVIDEYDANLIMGPPKPRMVAAPAGTAASTDSLRQWITELVARVNKISFAAIGLIGIATLIYAAISMIVEIERAFNQIYRVPLGRSWARRIVNYWALLTLGTLGLFATFYIQQQFGVWVTKWTHGRTGLGSGELTLSILGFAMQWFISSMVLLLLYTAVPNTRVRFVPALVAALLSAAIFEASKFGFGKYVEFSAGTSYARLYGSLALIPLFLLWVYFSWLIVLFGAQLTYQIQHGRSRTRAQPLMDMPPTLVDPSAVLTVLAALGRSFNRGATLDAPALADLTRLADPIVRVVLAKAAERNLVHRIENPSSTGNEAAEPNYALARPPATITISELLQAGFELAGTGNGLGGSGEDPLIQRIRRAQIDAAGSETLADALADTSVATSPVAVSPAILRPGPKTSSNGLHKTAPPETPQPLQPNIPPSPRPANP